MHRMYLVNEHQTDPVGVCCTSCQSIDFGTTSKTKDRLWERAMNSHLGV